MKSIMRGLNTNLLHSNIFRIPFITILVIYTVLIVDLTGGAPNAYMHLIYIPVILSAYYWGILGGTIVAIVAGILISPFAPVLITEAIIQSDNNYIVRFIILTSVGFVTGYTFNKVNKLNEQAKKRAWTNSLTGTFNINKLFIDTEKRINNNESFAMVSIKLTNINQISKYTDQNVIGNILEMLINELASIFSKDVIYMLGYDEINLLVSLNSGYIDECARIIERYSTLIRLEHRTYRILVN